jgi:hypothetical protein
MIARIAALASLAALAHAQCFPAGSLSFRSPVAVAAGLSATPIARTLTTPRGIALDARGNALVIERGLGVTAFVEGAPACPGGWLRSLVVNNSALTQGIVVNGHDLYASTSGQVLRYAYDPQTRTVAEGAPTVVVSGIPPDGGTRLL